MNNLRNRVAFPGAVWVQLGWKLWIYWTGWTKTAQFCRVNGRIGHHLHIRIRFFTSLGSRFKSSARSQYRDNSPEKTQIWLYLGSFFLVLRASGAVRVILELAVRGSSV